MSASLHVSSIIQLEVASFFSRFKTEVIFFYRIKSSFGHQLAYLWVTMLSNPNHLPDYDEMKNLYLYRVRTWNK